MIKIIVSARKANKFQMLYDITPVKILLNDELYVTTSNKEQEVNIEEGIYNVTVKSGLLKRKIEYNFNENVRIDVKFSIIIRVFVLLVIYYAIFLTLYILFFVEYDGLFPDINPLFYLPVVITFIIMIFYTPNIEVNKDEL